MGSTVSEPELSSLVLVSNVEAIACWLACLFGFAATAGGAEKTIGGGASPPLADEGLSIVAGDWGRDGA